MQAHCEIAIFRAWFHGIQHDEYEIQFRFSFQFKGQFVCFACGFVIFPFFILARYFLFFCSLVRSFFRSHLTLNVVRWFFFCYRVKQTSISAAVRYCPTSNDIWKMNHPGEKWWQRKAIRLCKMFSIWRKEAFLLCNRLHFSSKINDGKWEHAIFQFVKFYSVFFSRWDNAVRTGNTFGCVHDHKSECESHRNEWRGRKKKRKSGETNSSRADGLRCQTKFIHR